MIECTPGACKDTVHPEICRDVSFLRNVQIVTKRSQSTDDTWLYSRSISY